MENQGLEHSWNTKIAPMEVSKSQTNNKILCIRYRLQLSNNSDNENVDFILIAIQFFIYMMTYAYQ